ncbi:hypothetical protein GGF31_004755 [Allomyces arbusculus]|nr:hypothetical protein GGF31_004755 [Allomyces arbusculus]
MFRLCSTLRFWTGFHRTTFSSARPYLTKSTSATRTVPTSSSTPPPLTGWRKYAVEFKQKPGSHLTGTAAKTFLVLHELTAVVPLPIVYYGLTWAGLSVPVPDSLLEESNAKIRRVIKYYGWDIEPNSQAMVNMVAAYAIVKALMPLRLAARHVPVAMTPGLARIMDRALHRVRQFRHASPSGPSP